MGIFNETAPKLWALGLPVMPLYPKDKAPIITNWQSLAERMPTPEEQSFWLKNYENYNIGLPLGPQSGCVALDIDTENPDLLRIIETLVPPSPWNRVGHKGKVMLFKFTGHKTFRIKDIDGVTICELLSTKTQVVLPPSIHPKTQAPYVADNNLEDVVRNLPELHPDIETILRSAFLEYGVTLSHSGWTRTTDYISKGSRDVKMTSVAGFFANGITRGELSVKEAINRMYAWYSSCVEKVAGDDVDIEKGIKNMFSFLVQDVTGPKQKPLPKGWDDDLSDEEKKAWGLNFDAEMEEWDYERLKAYLFDQFSLHGEDSPQRTDAIEYILKRISRSPNLTSLDEDRILKYITQSCKSIQLSAVRKRLSELKTGSVKGTDHTELAKATLAELSKVSDVRFYQDNFWQWQGSNWEILSKQEIYSIIANNFGHLPAATRASDHQGIVKVLQNIVEQGIVATPTFGVNFANGFVTTDGQLHQHAKGYGMTYTLPFRYLPEYSQDLRHCPKFEKFLKSVWGKEPDYEERVQSLREAVAATYFGMGTSFARAVLLFGIAGSGKSQLLEIIKNLLPANAVSYVPPYKFDDKFEVTELSRSIMNICGELKEDKKIPGAAFKQLIDGSAMNGQFKNRPIFSFIPKAMHWFASNHLPKTDDATEGFNRRWLILSFNHPVPKEEKVRDIGNLIVSEEREAIAAWVIGCIDKLTKKGDIFLPKSHYAIMQDLASENDTLFFFLTSEKGPRHVKDTSNLTAKIHVDRLYEEYTAFCYGIAHARPVGLRKYLQRLKELGIFMGFRIENMMVYGLTMEKDPRVIEETEPLFRSF